MRNPKIASLVESWLLTAIGVILAFLGVYLPVFGPAVLMILPLPGMVLVVRHGIRWGCLACFVTGLLLALLIEPLMALRVVLLFAPIALGLGWGYRKGWPSARTLLVTFGAAWVSTLLGMGLLVVVAQINPFDLQLAAAQNIVPQVIEIQRSGGANAADIAAQAEVMERMLHVISYMGPLCSMLLPMLATLIAFFAGNCFLQRLGVMVPQLPRFRDWRLPQVILYAFGFAMVGLYWGVTRNIDFLYMASLNVTALSFFAGMLQGTSLLWYAADRWRLGTLVRSCIFCFLLLEGAMFLVFMGLFDMVFDYRRRFDGGKNDSLK